MDSANLTAENRIALRSRIFSILEESIGRAFTDIEFAEFHVGIFEYQSSEGLKITHENMSDFEKRIVLEHYTALMYLVDIDFPPFDSIARRRDAAMIHRGISEYRVNVAPEFAHIFWNISNYDTMSFAISNLALSNEEEFTEICASRNSNGEVNEFIELNSRFIKTIAPEYDLTD